MAFQVVISLPEKVLIMLVQTLTDINYEIICHNLQLFQSYSTGGGAVFLPATTQQVAHKV